MNGYLPGFEPDAAERAQLRFVGGVLDLRQSRLEEWYVKVKEDLR